MKTVSIRLSKEQIKTLDKLCKRYNLSRSRMVQRIVYKYVKDYLSEREFQNLIKTMRSKKNKIDRLYKVVPDRSEKDSILVRRVFEKLFGKGGKNDRVCVRKRVCVKNQQHNKY